MQLYPLMFEVLTLLNAVQYFQAHNAKQINWLCGEGENAPLVPVNRGRHRYTSCNNYSTRHVQVYNEQHDAALEVDFNFMAEGGDEYEPMQTFPQFQPHGVCMSPYSSGRSSAMKLKLTPN